VNIKSIECEMIYNGILIKKNCKLEFNALVYAESYDLKEICFQFSEVEICNKGSS